MDTGAFLGFEVQLEDPGIVWVTFNAPERLNGMTSSIKRDLIEMLNQAQMDNGVRIIVFIDKGRAFCAGDNLKGYTQGIQTEPGLVPPYHPVRTTASAHMTAYA